MNSFIAGTDIISQSHDALDWPVPSHSASPTAPWCLIVSDVSREWPRAPPFPGPGPVTETRNTGVRICQDQDPEIWRIFLTKNGPGTTNILKCLGPMRSQMLTQTANWVKDCLGDKNAPGVPCSCIFNSLNHNSLDI